jgi:hypothetical protein
MNKKLIIFIILALFLLLIIFFFISKRNTNWSDTHWADIFSDIATDDKPVYPLKLGYEGNEVKILQRAINTLYINKDMANDKPFPLDEDGIYGELTQAAVIRYLSVIRGNVQGQVSYVEAKKLEKLYEMEIKPQTT